MKRSIRLSVVIPIYNGEAHLADTLVALQTSTVRPFECVVVDDGSTDGSLAIAKSFGCTVLSTGVRQGPANARNVGAQAAQGDVIVFLDADVCVHANALKLFRAHFQADLQLAAAFGSYDSRPRHPAFVSQFRNLLHCHIHQTGNRDASTFWSGCGAVRREWFTRVDGFRTRYRKPSIEDIDLGYRIKAAGGRIVLDPAILVTHQKRWSLRGMVQSDVLDRAAPWTRLILESGRCANDLNLRKRRRLSTLLACLGCVFPAMAWVGWSAVTAFGLAAAAMMGSTLLDLDFYRFMRRVRGVPYALGSIPLYLLFHVYSAVGLALGTMQHALAMFSKPARVGMEQLQALEDVEAEEASELRA